MFMLIGLAVIAALVFSGFYQWARRHGQLTDETTGEREQRKRRIPLLTEAVAYIGAILVLAGGVAAIGQRWAHFTTWGQVALLAGAAAFFFLVGILVRGVREPAIQRLVSVTWFLSVAGVAAAAGLATHDLIYTPGDPNADAVTILSVGLAAAVYSAALWLARRRAVQAAALFAGLVITICGIIATVAGTQPAHWAPLAYALALWVFGLAWAALGWRRYIEPMWATVPLGATLALIAPMVATGPYGWMYATGIVTAATAMAISVPLRNTVFLGLGAVAMFGYVTSVAVTYFHQSLGVPAALSITGVLIIGLAVITARLMRATRPPKPAEAAPRQPGPPVHPPGSTEPPGTTEPPQATRPPEATEPPAGTPARRDLPKAS